MGDNLKDRAKNLMLQYWNFEKQLGIKSSSDDDEDNEEVDPNLYKVERGDDPRDVVSEDTRMNESPNTGSRYKLKPSYGVSLSDLLSKVANKLEVSNPKIAKTLSTISILDYIKKVFATNKLSLLSYDDPFIELKEDDIVYYWKEINNGIKIWLNKNDLSVNSVLNEVIKQLVDFGYTVTKLGDGIFVSNGKTDIHAHNPEEVAVHLRGKVWSGKKQQKNWHTIAINGCKLSYTLFPAGTVTVCCSGLYGDTTTTYKVNNESRRHLLNILKYQSERYLRLFDPSTYGLQQESKPFRLKKHVLIPCTNNCILVITPTDTVVLLHSKGEHSLCHDEGKLGLNLNKSFKTVDHTNEALYKDGETYNGFASLLKKRGYLQ